MATEKNRSQSRRDLPGIYELRIDGHLDSQWSDWFDGLAITVEDDGQTLLTGQLADQAALHGLLKKVRDFGLPLLSVNRIDPDHDDESVSKQN